MKQTIAAISTALNPSGIGIVRVTGPEAMDILYSVYRSKHGKKDIRKADPTVAVVQHHWNEFVIIRQRFPAAQCFIFCF